MRLDGKVAIVTGAGYGIGRATALRFVEEGAEVVIAEKDGKRGRKVEEECRSAGGRALFIETDVTLEQNIIDMTSETVETYGHLDVLVNNAGIGYGKDVQQTTVEDWETFMALDLRSVFLCSREALGPMVRQGRGSIVNISSVHSRQTLPQNALYAAAKGGISAMTRSMAIDYGPMGIRINAVCPGMTRTGIWEQIETRVRSLSAYEELWIKSTPLQRIQEPVEVANCCLFLASDESSFVTGTELFTDGGATAMVIAYPSKEAEPLH